ncbi:MAG TPA: GFA family protein [Thermoleophilaceae bacterium]
MSRGAPSADAPLRGGCLCGSVRFEVTEDFVTAGYCHCTHCQRRTGTASSAQVRVRRSGFRLLKGSELLRAYGPRAGCRRSSARRAGRACSPATRWPTTR